MDITDLQVIQHLFLDRICEFRDLTPKSECAKELMRYYEDLMNETLEILEKEIDKQQKSCYNKENKERAGNRKGKKL